MTKGLYTYLLLIFLSIFTSACSSKRNLTYFKDLVRDSSYSIAKTDVEYFIKKGDILYISVSSEDIESTAIFNLPNSGGSNNNQFTNSPGYLVDETGNINFPKAGQVQASGKSKTVLKSELEKILTSYLKNPIVTIRNINYKVTLLGEVARPGTFTTPNERMSLLEALSQAGDLTDFGRRDNVLLIREIGNKQQYFRLNLNDRSSIKNEFYYLQPNDVLYVEPIKSKKFRSSTFSQFGPLTISTISFLISIIIRL
jgi:polysaccharide export outer membrane protein